jgi:hypothetical protein
MNDDRSPPRKNLFDVLWRLVRPSDPWWVRLPFAALLVLGLVACVALASGSAGKLIPPVLRLLGRWW